ncbi:molybdenum cofactor guanylyltransferase [Sphaerisporangium perillae]|uniref:molybdenum cofactor guanylyltransferase n=1 Tax=Sphaerisporangium perillae TaxID=2935860 RepID=UPI0027DFF01D|nr:molybdenum cofactor guanylyltransferase [Sphaerisporangium perillae]
MPAAPRGTPGAARVPGSPPGLPYAGPEPGAAPGAPYDAVVPAAGPYDAVVPTAVPYDAVVLAGGEARRLGGGDKPGVSVGGLTLIERVVAAVPGAARLVVVGPARPGLPRGEFAREDPPGGGPIPALRAGLARVQAPWVALLAADLPFLLPGHVAALLAAAGTPPRAGAVLVDEDGREQWLTGVWRTETLARALAGYEGRSLRGLLGPLDPVRLGLPVGDGGRVPWFDCDTIDDVADARRRMPHAAGEATESGGRAALP